MPELPEVETIRRQLDEKISGLTITDVNFDVEKMFKGNKKDLIGSKIKSVNRRAKLLEVNLDNKNTILLHLKMTGQLLYNDKSSTDSYSGDPLPPLKTPIPNKSTHVTFSFDNGAVLYFNDLRKFGYVKILPTGDVEHSRIMSEFGPEPLDPKFGEEDFYARLQKRKGVKIKQLLLDQKFLAGVGNIYANESLYRAGINPSKKAGDLGREESNKLFHYIKKVLEIGIKAGGASDQTYVNAFGKKGKFMDFAKIYGKKGEICEFCGSKFERIALGGRGTFFCPTCQK